MLYGSTGMSHEAQQKLLLFSNGITLNPSGTPSTRISHEYSSIAESWAAPVLRQLGHLSFSTQQSRAIHNMRRSRETFLMSLRRHYGRTKRDHCFAKRSGPKAGGGHMLGPPSDAKRR
jgi:hypothetical protein